MLRWKHFNWMLGAAVGGGLWGACALPAAEVASPLERLKQRSAESRWVEVKETLLQRQPSTLPTSESNPRTAQPGTPNSPLSDGDVGAWRSADDTPAPEQLNAPTAELQAPVALTPAPDRLQVPGPALGSTAPPFPDVATLPQPESSKQRAVERDRSLVNEVAVDNRNSINRALPGRQFSVPEPYTAGEATLVEANEPAIQDDSAALLRHEQPVQLGQTLLGQGPEQPLIVPNPEQYLVESLRPELLQIPPSPMLVAQNDLLPAPSPKDESELYAFRPITEIEPFRDYAPSGQQVFPEGDLRSRLPKVVALPSQGSIDRVFAPTQFQWEAANIFHNPLYFEDVELERYGHTYPWGLQPAASLAKFGVQFIGLPYSMAMDPICKEEYALGYYRPGDCAPKLHYQIPLDKRAAITAAGVYTGLFFIFP